MKVDLYREKAVMSGGKRGCKMRLIGGEVESGGKMVENTSKWPDF